MRFRHEIIDAKTPGIENDVLLIADINGDGYNDIFVGGKRYEDNLVWYEYPTWKRHIVGTDSLEAGGAMVDITGNGLPDFVGGHPEDAYPASPGTELFWYENPGEPGRRWGKHIIDSLYVGQHHDQVAGDVDGDGRNEIVFACQNAGVIGYYTIPDDPFASPWPDECRCILCDDLPAVEGLGVVDLNGDGVNDILAGPYWFEQTADGWKRHVLDSALIRTTAAYGDINGDGLPEIVLAEGESYPARLVWFGNAPHFDEVHVLATDFFHPHTLAVADMNNDGLLDIVVGEMGLDQKHPGVPELAIYINTGNGEFRKEVIARGHPIHSGKVGDIGNTGRLSIVGKPYRPGTHVEAWINESTD